MKRIKGVALVAGIFAWSLIGLARYGVADSSDNAPIQLPGLSSDADNGGLSGLGRDRKSVV